MVTLTLLPIKFLQSTILMVASFHYADDCIRNCQLHLLSIPSGCRLFKLSIIMFIYDQILLSSTKFITHRQYPKISHFLVQTNTPFKRIELFIVHSIILN